MKIKNILIVILVFVSLESKSEYKPIFSHYGYPTKSFIKPTFQFMTENRLRNDFDLKASTLLGENNGIYISANMYNKNFIPTDYKMHGIVPTKIFPESRLSICKIRKINSGEYFFVGPAIRSISLFRDFWTEPDLSKQYAPTQKNENNFGFHIGYSKIIAEKISIISDLNLFNSKYRALMYTIELNFNPIDNVSLTLGSGDQNLYSGFSLINNYGKIGYRATFHENKIFHGIHAGLALNY